MSLPSLSFEFFPPRSVEASFRLHAAVESLAPLKPDFVSVTYGAGGTTRELTHEAVMAIERLYGLRVAAHLTCVDASRAEVMEHVTRYRDSGIRDLVALRGDAPDGAERFTPHPEGFASSVELIAALRQQDPDLTIRVGAYPDPHPDAPSAAAGIDYLKAKFDAGADTAITQFFFDPESFLRFRDACVRAGIEKPITPGILPITDWGKIRNFAKRCAVPVPKRLDRAFQTAERDGRSRLLAIAEGTDLCSRLVAEGVEHLHFYTLNSPGLTRDICIALGHTPDISLARVA